MLITKYEFKKLFEHWLVYDYFTKNGFMGSPKIKQLKILFEKEFNSQILNNER